MNVFQSLMSDVLPGEYLVIESDYFLFPLPNRNHEASIELMQPILVEDFKVIDDE